MDIADLGTVAESWQQSPVDWYQGDFNFDGIDDISDLGTLAQNWQQGRTSQTLGHSGGSAQSLGEALDELGLSADGIDPDLLDVTSGSGARL